MLTDYDWWDEMSDEDREQMFEELIEILEADGSDAAEFMGSVYDQYRSNGHLTPRQISAVRKFQENR